MKRIKVAGAALNQTPLDWDGNLKNILSVIDEASERKVSVLCLPELCITGYGCEDAFYAPFVQEKSIEMIQQVLNHSAFDIVISIGFPMLIKNTLYNCIGLVYNNRLLGIVPKQHLAGDGLHYEPRWFKPWKDEKTINVIINSSTVPFGNMLFSFNGIKVGLEVCEDAWVADRPGIDLARMGADIILNPSASHFAFNKHKVRERFVEEGSRSQNVAYVYSNLLGNESGRIIFDGDTLIASGGEIIASGELFSFKDTSLSTAVIDIDKNRLAQSKLSSFDPLYSSNVIMASANINLDSKIESSDNVIIKSYDDKFVEFTKAATLGLFDYMRKSHSQGFTLSLSGGADSSACAMLVYLMYGRASFELGTNLFIKKSGIDLLPNTSDSDIMKKLLTCVYQRTKNSSEETEEAAEAMAKITKARYFSWSVDKIVDNYESLVQNALGLNLNWNEHDIAKQNIQARARIPALWMLANINNSLLLCTSNRSEAAVGYASCDGDTSGGLAPLAGIDKNFLLDWLEHFDLKPMKPTAELRPNNSNQTDEDDLMPYNILDVIEKFAIRDKKSPSETFVLVNELFKPESQDAKNKLKEHVIKFFEMWSKNQWKREKYAVSFHYDDESLDPKTWCRWPVLSSGLKSELEKLKNE